MAGVVVDPVQPGPPQRLPSLMAALMAAVSSATGQRSQPRYPSRGSASLPPSPTAPHILTFLKTS